MTFLDPFWFFSVLVDEKYLRWYCLQSFQLQGMEKFEHVTTRQRNAAEYQSCDVLVRTGSMDVCIER